MSEQGEYTLELREGGATLRGVMRLVSPAAYRSALAAVHEQLDGRRPAYELDVSGLEFLNSSGITALSRLILLARDANVALTFVVDPERLWQKKTLPSLARLYPRIDLRNR